MRVAFFHFFPQGMWIRTGDMTQIHKTRDALLRIGVEVELFDPWKGSRDYDIIHVFGNTHELASFVSAAKAFGAQVVFSPISTTQPSAWKWRVWGVVDRWLPVSTTYTNLKRIFSQADIVLPGSKAEATWIRRAFGIPESRMRVVHFGVDRFIAEASPEPFLSRFPFLEHRRFVLMVARISCRKGQIRLIKAMEGLGVPLAFIGHPSPYEPDYFRCFQAEVQARPWAHYLGALPESLVYSAYAAARVHVLPSRGECPGAVSLEAGIAGANVVVADEPAVREHLGQYAYYCNPTSPSSIRDAVARAYASSIDGGLRNHLLHQYTWDHVASVIASVYRQLMEARERSLVLPHPGPAAEK